MSTKVAEIQCILNCRYNVNPEEVPTCAVCDQPMFRGEPLQFEYCDMDVPGFPACVRLIHLDCADDYDEEEDAA